MARQIINDAEYDEDDFREWEKTIKISRYEHDFENKRRIIDYNNRA